jgi:hypothetical protein
MVDAEDTVVVARTVAGVDGTMEVVVDNAASVRCMVIVDDCSVATVDVVVRPVPSNRWKFGKIEIPFPPGCWGSELMAMMKTGNKARKKKH